MDATEEATDGEEALSDAKGDASDINDTGIELVEVGGSTQLGKKTAAQIRATQAKARVFMRIFARKVKVLQRILIAQMQVCSVFIVALLMSFLYLPSSFCSPPSCFLLPNTHRS